MNVNRIELENPRAQRTFDRKKHQILVGVFCVLAWLFLEIGFIGGRTQGLVYLYAVSGVSLLCVGVVLYLTSKRGREERQEYLELFRRLPDGVVHSASTELGWVAYGKDWIGAVSQSNLVSTLPFNQIDKMYWGGPHGRWSKFGEVGDFELPKNAINENSSSHWVLVLAKEDVAQSLFFSFKKPDQANEWVEICKQAKTKGSISAKSDSQIFPTKKQLDGKARWVELNVWLVIAGIILLLVCATLSKGAIRISGAFINLLFFAAIMPQSFISGDRMKASELTWRMLFSISGGDIDLEDKSHPPIAEGRLFLHQTGYDGPQLEVIPLSSIRQIGVKDWGNRVSNRDVSKLLKPKATPVTRSLTLTLDNPKNPEREIRLTPAQAKTWKEELSNLLSAERSPA